MNAGEREQEEDVVEEMFESTGRNSDGHSLFWDQQSSELIVCLSLFVLLLRESTESECSSL